MNESANPEYRVKIELFEGPLDLLLYLIKKNELDIYDIPIAAITEQYLRYIKMMKNLNIEIASEYLVMAATLAQIKSRTLLPPPDEAEGEEEDPRAELIRQLLEYQRYKEAAESLITRDMLGRDTFVPDTPEEPEPLPQEVEIEASLFELLDAFRAILSRVSERAEGGEAFLLEEVSQYRISLSDRMDEILLQLGQAAEQRSDQIGIPFEELFQNQTTRGMVIATFLALLELMRLRLVKLVQFELFGPIWVRGNIAPASEESPEPTRETAEEPSGERETDTDGKGETHGDS